MAKWQPMNTAPTDQEVRLKCSDGRSRRGRWSPDSKSWFVGSGQYVLNDPVEEHEGDDCELIFTEAWKPAA